MAVFRKKKEFGSIDKYNNTQITKSVKRKYHEAKLDEPIVDAEQDVDESVPEKVKSNINGEAPFVWASPENKVIANCMYSILTRKEYGLQSSFPLNYFFVRSENLEEDFASIYIVSKKVKEVLTCVNHKSLRVVNTGVKLFVKNGGKDLYFFVLILVINAHIEYAVKEFKPLHLTYPLSGKLNYRWPIF